MIDKILLLFGMTIFLTGYFFVAKSHGDQECAPPKHKTFYDNINYTGGIAGIVIGLMFILVGTVLYFSSGIKSYDQRLSDAYRRL